MRLCYKKSHRQWNGGIAAALSLPRLPANRGAGFDAKHRADPLAHPLGPDPACRYGRLSLRKNGTWYTYSHDLTKNVTELYNADSTIATAYDYTPYGAVTATGIEQPIQWSSEHYDTELGMVYYNYRHYNPMDGRWINRDPIMEQGGYNLYGFVGNRSVFSLDRLGYSDRMPKCEVDSLTVEAMCRRLIGSERKRGRFVLNDNETILPPSTVAETQTEMGSQGNTPFRDVNLKIDATFKKDFCKCCEIRHYIQIDPQAFFEQSNQILASPDVFYEDRDVKGNTYGHRNVKNKNFRENLFYYYHKHRDGSETLDYVEGDRYKAYDTTSTDKGGVWTFQIRVIDVCSKKSKTTEDVVKAFTFKIDWNH